jgi:hypothetical protein
MTTRIDLDDPEQAKEWLSRLKQRCFQEQITGLTIVDKGVQYSLTRPKGFNRVFFFAEVVEADPELKIKGGERITAQMDETKISLMVHNSQRAARLSAMKTGKLRFNPLS